MDVKFLTPFVQSAVEVLAAELGGPVERGQISLQRSAYTTSQVSVMLTLVGSLEGAVIYSMTEETALAMVSHMMGQPTMELDDLAQSGVAELGNVITGRASMLLATAGYTTTISVPTVLVGKTSLSIADFQRLVVPLTCPCGLIETHLALREVHCRTRM